MDDLISRKMAIDAIENAFDRETILNRFVRKIAISAVRLLPSAQPERKKGKWEIYVISMLDGEGCRCSECGFEGMPHWDFCPNCGCQMERRA